MNKNWISLKSLEVAIFCLPGCPDLPRWGWPHPHGEAQAREDQSRGCRVQPVTSSSWGGPSVAGLHPVYLWSTPAMCASLLIKTKTQLFLWGFRSAEPSGGRREGKQQPSRLLLGLQGRLRMRQLYCEKPGNSTWIKEERQVGKNPPKQQQKIGSI